jgi:hypothetical protein
MRSKPQPIEYLPGTRTDALMPHALASKTGKLASVLERSRQSERGLQDRLRQLRWAAKRQTLRPLR